MPIRTIKVLSKVEILYMEVQSTSNCLAVVEH